VQLFGVKVDVGTTKGIIIQASDYLKTPPLHFQAVCRWVKRENPLGYHLSGFEISSISTESRENLYKLMEFVTLG
jgi:hypothetical protein